MTLVVLGLDALDHRLVETFGCNSLPLNNSGPLESISYSMEFPLTTEVWPSVATGLHPQGHGITKSGASSWDNPLVALASKLLEPLPHDVRVRLGDIAMDTFGAAYKVEETDKPTIFDGEYREVHNWPGVHNSHFVRERWQTVAKPAKDPEYSAAKFDRKVLPVGAEKFGWLEEILQFDVELAGVHIHVLDLAGHAYASQESELRRYYDWMDDRVDRLLGHLSADDDLLIVSDHGMGASWIPGDEPGVHSSRAFVSSTVEGDLPMSVLDVREWVEECVVPVRSSNDRRLDVDEEHLRDLGYL